MKNKKAILAGTLVTVIGFAIVIWVVLNFYSAILAVLRALGEDYFWCVVKKIISAHVRVPLIGTEVWGSFCLPVYKTITMLDEGEKTIPINVPVSKREIENLKKWYPGEDFEKTDWYLRYRLDQTVAQAMKRCWGRNGQGELPLGKKWNDKFWSSKEYIFYCDLCAVYSFDPKVQAIFNDKSPLVLNEFLQKNPVRPGSSESLWVYLKDKDSDTELREVRYSTKNDLSVVYIRANRNNFNELLRDVFVDILPGFGEKDHPIPLDAVLLMTFDEYSNRCIKRT